MSDSIGTLLGDPHMWEKPEACELVRPPALEEKEACACACKCSEDCFCDVAVAEVELWHDYDDDAQKMRMWWESMEAYGGEG